MIDALIIKPIILYSGHFRLKLSRSNHIENMHVTICKHLLGMQKQTTDVGVLLELGRIPLCLYMTQNLLLKGKDQYEHRE